MYNFCWLWKFQSSFSDWYLFSFRLQYFICIRCYNNSRQYCIQKLQYSISVAIEISKRYLDTQKDVRLGRLSFDQNEFSYYNHDVGFLSLIQKISRAINSSADIDMWLSQARSQLLLANPWRNKVVVLISEGHWSNVSRVRYEVQEMGSQNVTVMIVAISENSDFTQMYEAIQDPFYVFLINDVAR